SDRDGLSDEEETTLGTDKNLVDTDSDGINDNAEVNIYKTNPLKADTDGDSYSDGQEIMSNYDPNDPTPSKKLFTIEEELNKTNPDIK
ncbi:MAG: OmpA family protein, partial [Patescibacteria group bacterium]